MNWASPLLTVEKSSGSSEYERPSAVAYVLSMAITAGRRRPAGLYLESSPDERYGVLPGEDRLVRDLMCRDVATIHPTASMRDAARLMRDRGTPHLVVLVGRRLEGVLDEHDIVVRGATQTAPPDAVPVKTLLPAGRQPVCREDAIVADAARLMAEHHRQTVAVVDGQSRVVGVLGLLDVARAVMPQVAATWLSRIQRSVPRA